MMHPTQILSRSACLAIFALFALCFASAASALANGPWRRGDPNLPPPKPNLVIGNASITAGTLVNDWAISYTVTNRGNAPAGAFRVAVQQDGTAILKDSYQASLTAGASRSETIHILRTNCYIAVRFTADSATSWPSRRNSTTSAGDRPDIAVVPDAAEVHGEGRFVPCERRERRRLARLGRAVLGLQRRGDGW